MATGRRGASLFLMFVMLAPAISGCGGGPRLNFSGEPVGLPPYVTSQKIDPRTLRPIEPEHVRRQKEPKETAPKKLAE